MNYEKYTGLAQALFEESRDALVLIDLETNEVLDANRASQRLCGFSLRDLIAAPVSKFLRCQDLRGFLPMPVGARRVHGRFPRHMCRLRCFESDTWMPVDVTLTRLRTNEHSLGLLTLANARTRVLKRLWNRQRLRRLVLNLHSCLWNAQVLSDGTVRFPFITPVVKRLSGRPAKYFTRGLDSWAQIILPEDRTKWLEQWERALSGKSTETEYRITWPDGSIRWLRESIRVSKNSHAQFIELTGITSDITSLRQSNHSRLPSPITSNA